MTRETCHICERTPLRHGAVCPDCAAGLPDWNRPYLVALVENLWEQYAQTSPTDKPTIHRARKVYVLAVRAVRAHLRYARRAA